MIRVIACLSVLLLSAGHIGQEKEICSIDCCEHARLAQIMLNAKIDPAALSTALDELLKTKDNPAHGHHVIAALYFWELEEWSRFLSETDPKLWPERIDQTSPTMVLADEMGECIVFYGGFGYRVGSQFGRSGWFITEITAEDMEIEHQGTDFVAASWEVERVTFKPPYLKPLMVGPGGFSKRLEIPRISWEELEENWKPDGPLP